VPPDSNIAETEPKKFAQMLSDKLQRLKEDEERTEKITNLTNSLRNNDVCKCYCYEIHYVGNAYVFWPNYV
jgi:hypothetical protein